ncbi:lipopolysaccharide-binding protein-like [Tachysurus fulvidraco]|uniref:lipopolysaccharide-binding protein-like n=1 Tax=Tachysurus fulvidraco TaxID=1234273 RepID=UPI001FEE3F07|nr:lipopolysaccharide-binding protein-like [Tachysurus fulvidraco]
MYRDLCVCVCVCVRVCVFVCVCVCYCRRRLCESHAVMDTVRVDMVSLWCVLSLLTFLSLEASGTNPVTPKGLDYELEISINPLREKLKTIQIPNMSGRADVLFTDVSYTVSSMKIEDVSLVSMAVRLVPGTGLSLSISIAYIGLKGNWEVKNLFKDDDGWFTLSIFDIRISTTFGVSNDGQGHPRVYAESCSASFGQVKIDLHGGSSWLYQLFDSYINSALLNSLQPQICTMVTEAINSINPHLKTVNGLCADRDRCPVWRIGFT